MEVQIMEIKPIIYQSIPIKLIINWLFLLSLQSFALAAEIPVPTKSFENYSYLANQNFSASQSINIKIFGSQKRIAEIQQAYNATNRGYQDREQRGMLTAYDRIVYTNNNSGFSNSTYTAVVSTAKQTQTQPYIDNINAANQRGEFGEPVKYAAVVIAASTGNPIKTDAGFAVMTSKLDLLKSNGSLNITSPVTNADISITPKGAEAYSLSLNRPIPVVNCSVSYSYAGTSQTSRFSVSRQIWKTLSGEISNVVGPPTLAPQQQTYYRLNYGLTF